MLQVPYGKVKEKFVKYANGGTELHGGSERPAPGHRKRRQQPNEANAPSGSQKHVPGTPVLNLEKVDGSLPYCHTVQEAHPLMLLLLLLLTAEKIRRKPQCSKKNTGPNIVHCREKPATEYRRPDRQVRKAQVSERYSAKYQVKLRTVLHQQSVSAENSKSLKARDTSLFI